MKTRVLTVVGLVALAMGCSEKKSSDDSRSSTPEAATESATDTSTVTATDTSQSTATDTSQTTTTSPTYGGVIAGTLAVGDGVPATALKGVAISVESRPELAAVTNDKGEFKLENVLPGTVTLYAVSGSTSLNLAGETLGVKVDEIVVKDKEKTDIGKQTLKPTGAITGSVSFLNAAPVLAGSDVFVPGTGFDAKTDDQGNFTISGLPEGEYSLYAMRDGFALAKLTKINVVSAQTTTADFVMSIATGPEGSLSVTTALNPVVDGAARHITENPAVTVDLKYDSDAALMKLSEEPSFIGKEWQPVAKTVSCNFAKANCFDAGSAALDSPDGKKTLYVMYSDTNGLESSPYKFDLYVDTEAPKLNAVSILNGWAITAKTDIPADLDASDSGSGLASYRISYVDQTFPGNPAWNDFAARVPIELQNTPGTQEIFVEVKDWAGHVSAYKADSIEKGDYTLIHAATYDKAMTLFAEHGPYRVSGTVVFAGDLTIKPHTVIRIDTNPQGHLQAKGVVKAEATSWTDKISITTYDSGGGNCGGYFEHELGAPGVTEKSRFKYVEFQGVPNLSFNGGRIEHARMYSTLAGCSTQGAVIKKGNDVFLMDHVAFDNWDYGINVQNGNGATTISHASGDVKRLIYQSGTATGTKVLDSDVETTGNLTDAAFHLEAGTITQSGNSISGTSAVLYFGTSGTFTLSDVTVTGCHSVVQNSGGGSGKTVTINNSTISGCDYGVFGLGASDVTFTNNALAFVRSLVHLPNFDTGEVTLTLNEITGDTLGDTSHFADFLTGYGNVLDATLTLNNNNITCNTANRCRGGFVWYANGGGPGSELSLAFSGNSWDGTVGPGFGLGTTADPTDCDDAANLFCRDGITLNTQANPGTTSRLYEFRAGANDGHSAYTTWNITGQASFTTDHASNASAGDPN